MALLVQFLDELTIPHSDSAIVIISGSALLRQLKHFIMMEPSQVISVAKKRRLRKRKLKEFAGQASPDEKKIKVETIKVESTESDNAEAEQKSEKNKIKQKKKKEKVKKYVVFVGNLAYNTTEEDIKEHFSQTSE